MATRHRNCRACGKQFEYEVSRGADRLYCGQGCAIQHQKANRKTPTAACSVFGCDRHANRVSAGLCETHYYRKRRTGTTFKAPSMGRSLPNDRIVFDSCQHCGVQTDGRKYCSRRCNARGKRGCVTHATCNGCGALFVPINKAEVCSPQCKVLHKRTTMREWVRGKMLTDPAFVAKKRVAELNRKARKANAFVEQVDRDVVMSRCNWVCHLCSHPIPPDAIWPSPEFGTVDHVIPLAKGGEHSYRNTKAAHLRCNCKKGARLQVAA